MPEFNADTLLNMGFRDVAFWYVSDDRNRLTYGFDGPNAKANEELFAVSNVLYAFVEGDEVRYIGKTTQSLRTRFIGYCSPSERQSTNMRNNKALREIISRNVQPRILVFTPISLLSYGEFPINLAAGLEDALVTRLAPAWNGARFGQGMTETAELEDKALSREAPKASTPTALPPGPAQSTSVQESLHDFVITLSATYYRQGMVNPGAEASAFLGANDDPVTLVFSDGTSEITSSINRTANRNGSVRFVGRNRLISDWFKAHFNEGDKVPARILTPNRVLLYAPEKLKSSKA